MLMRWYWKIPMTVRSILNGIVQEAEAFGRRGKTIRVLKPDDPVALTLILHKFPLGTLTTGPLSEDCLKPSPRLNGGNLTTVRRNHGLPSIWHISWAYEAPPKSTNSSKITPIPTSTKQPPT